MLSLRAQDVASRLLLTELNHHLASKDLRSPCVPSACEALLEKSEWTAFRGEVFTSELAPLT